MQTIWVARCACVVVAAIVIAQMPMSRVGAQEDSIGRETTTGAEIEQRTKLRQLTGQPALSRDQVIDELREEKLKIREGRRWGLGVSDHEVESAYAQLAARMRWTAEQLAQNLAQRGIDADTLKHRIRADIVWRQYLTGYRNGQKRGGRGDFWTPKEQQRYFGR
jgi:peptidyl-prolyl cis-trans isomerase SurA